MSVMKAIMRRAAAFGEADGAATVDWVTITSVGVVAGSVFVYFILGADGPVMGLVDSMNTEVNQLVENINGAAERSAPVIPGGAERDPAGG